MIFSLHFLTLILVLGKVQLFLLFFLLFISLLFHIFEKQVKNLKIQVSFLSFVNNGLLISQEKSLEKTNLFLFCSYNIVSFLLDQFGLVIKHRKTKVFHFTRSHSIFDPSLLDLSTLRGPVLTPKTKQSLEEDAPSHY